MNEWLTWKVHALISFWPLSLHHSLTVPGTVQVVNAVPKLFTSEAASFAAATTSPREAPLAAAAPAT